MPRELTLVTPVPITLEALVLSAQALDPTLRIRQAEGGALIQLVDDADAAVVLSLQQPSTLQVTSEIDRLLPEGSVTATIRAAIHQAAERTEAAWTEAFAPFGTRGELGVAVAQGLAEGLGGTCVVQDGR